MNFSSSDTTGVRLLSCNFLSCAFSAIPVSPYLVLDISHIFAACNEPLNYFTVSITRCIPQWSASVGIIECDIDTRILQQHFNNGHSAQLTSKRKGSPSISVLQVDIDVWVCQKQIDNFSLVVE